MSTAAVDASYLRVPECELAAGRLGRSWTPLLRGDCSCGNVARVLNAAGQPPGTTCDTTAVSSTAHPPCRSRTRFLCSEKESQATDGPALRDTSLLHQGLHGVPLVHGVPAPPPALTVQRSGDAGDGRHVFGSSWHSPPYMQSCQHVFHPIHLAHCSDREKQATDDMFAGESTGINFDAYEDIPVEVRSVFVF